jgi:hypothetical protein
MYTSEKISKDFILGTTTFEEILKSLSEVKEIRTAFPFVTYEMMCDFMLYLNEGTQTILINSEAFTCVRKWGRDCGLSHETPERQAQGYTIKFYAVDMMLSRRVPENSILLLSNIMKRPTKNDEQTGVLVKLNQKTTKSSDRLLEIDQDIFKLSKQINTALTQLKKSIYEAVTEIS